MDFGFFRDLSRENFIFRLNLRVDGRYSWFLSGFVWFCGRSWGILSWIFWVKIWNICLFITFGGRESVIQDSYFGQFCLYIRFLVRIQVPAVLFPLKSLNFSSWQIFFKCDSLATLSRGNCFIYPSTIFLVSWNVMFLSYLTSIISFFLPNIAHNRAVPFNSGQRFILSTRLILGYYLPAPIR